MDGAEADVLKKFQVPHEIAVRVAAADMRWTTEELLLAVGMPAADARQTADVLMYADLRGIDTHGVSNMLRGYLTGLASGAINPTPSWRVVRDNKATGVIDGDGGHGMVISPAAMNEAIKRAAEYGVGSVSVMNCRHLGPCSYYAQMALEHRMLGQATTTGGVSMVPTFGTRPLLGLNAMAFAAPTQRNPPFVYDASPSVVAGNKLALAKRLGQTVLPGWITDEHGNPIMEEAPLPEKYMLLPLGSTREGGSQKGYALSVISEIVTSLLCASGAGPRRRAGSVHHFLAYDIASFSEPHEFMADLDQYLTDLLECPTVSGEGRVLYSGYPEARTEAHRREHGIPYHPEVIEWFRTATAEHGVAWRLD
jgi:LDH2 family malate/lactate/ureidoglycolate dehydrogenase